MASLKKEIDYIRSLLGHRVPPLSVVARRLTALTGHGDALVPVDADIQKILQQLHSDTPDLSVVKAAVNALEAKALNPAARPKVEPAKAEEAAPRAEGVATK